jgi:hypothetical protein
MRTTIEDIEVGPNDDPVVAYEHHLLGRAMETYSALLDDEDHNLRKSAADRIVDVYGRCKGASQALLPPAGTPPTLMQLNFNLGQIGAATDGLVRLLEKATTAGVSAPVAAPAPQPASAEPV